MFPKIYNVVQRVLVVSSEVKHLLTIAAVCSFILVMTGSASGDFLYWDGTNVALNGASSGGAGTWSTTNFNWDTGSGYVAWPTTDTTNVTAVFSSSSAYTVTLGSDVSLNAINMTAAPSPVKAFAINGNANYTMHFQGENPAIATNPDGWTILTISSGISGKPDITHGVGGGSHSLSPAGSLTMDVGMITIFRANTSASTFNFGGATTNSAEGLFQSNVGLTVNKNDAGTWNVGSISRGTGGTLSVKVNAGSLISTGTWTNITGLTVAGGRLAGTPSILGAALSVTNSGSIAPGIPTGTMTVTNPTFQAGTSLEIYVDGGLSPTHSSLQAGGTLNISNATLNLNVVAPSGGTITIANCDNLLGMFAATNNLPKGWNVLYTTNSISLVPLPAGTVLIVR